eukprot:484801_1
MATPPFLNSALPPSPIQSHRCQWKSHQSINHSTQSRRPLTHGPINQPNQVINSICYKPLASTVIKQANWGNHYAIDSWDENNNNDDIKYDNNKEKELLENNNDINSDDEDNEKV